MRLTSTRTTVYADNPRVQDFGKRLRRVRERHGFDKAIDLARKILGLAPTVKMKDHDALRNYANYLSRLEKDRDGQSGNISLPKLEELADGLNLTLPIFVDELHTSGARQTQPEVTSAPRSSKTPPLLKPTLGASHVRDGGVVYDETALVRRIAQAFILGGTVAAESLLAPAGTTETIKEPQRPPDPPRHQTTRGRKDRA